MKKSVKGVVIGAIIGGILIVIGVILGLIFGFNGVNWDNSVKAANAEYKTANAQTVTIDAEVGEVKIINADVSEITVKYFADEKIKVNVEEKDGNLSVTQKINGMFFQTYGGEITVEIPNALTNLKLNVELNAGNVTAENLTANEFAVDVDAGTAKMKNVTATTLTSDVDAGEIELNTVTAHTLNAKVAAGQITGDKITAERVTASVDTGEIDLKIIGVQEEYTLTGKVSLGECNFNDRTGTTDKFINAQVDIGEITVTFIQN